MEKQKELIEIKQLQKELIEIKQLQNQQCKCPVIIHDSNDLCELCQHELNQWLEFIEKCYISE